MRAVCLPVLFALCVALLAPAASAQNIESEVQRLNDMLAQARADNLHLSSPRAFSDASEHLNDAQKKLRQGDKLSDIQRAVQLGFKRLVDGKEFTNIADVILKDAFAARNAALEARAPEFSKAKWKAAEEAMRSAGREIEKGDQNDARNDAKEAENHYREAELNAIQVNLLGTAREHRADAKQADAEEWARQTWTDAKRKLKNAEQILESDRSNRDESRMLAEEASRQFQRARLLTQTAKRIDDDVERNAEKALLQYESYLDRIAKALGTPITFDDGPDAATKRLVAAVQSQREDRTNLQATLEERRERIDRLQQMVDSLDKRAGSASAELQSQRERDQMLARVRALFQSEEAEVLTSGDAMIVRMKGLNFASGSAEIQPKNYGLLTKLQQVIREFSGPITISGHTDARGNDALNMKLSEQRAEAVRQYLDANMDLAPDRIQAVGRGESEPIATNETNEGRLQNRRIDVKIGFE